MDKDRFYEILKYLVYLFETQRTKRPGQLHARQDKIKSLIKELLEDIFKAKYIVDPRINIASVINYAKGFREIKLKHEAFTRLNIIRDNLPEGSRGDVEGFMNDLSQDISQYEGFPDSDPSGFKRSEIGDLLGSGAYYTIEVDKIIEYHCNRLKDLENCGSPSEKGSSDFQVQLEVEHQGLLAFGTRESTADLIGRLGLDELEGSEITEAFNRCDTVGRDPVLRGYPDNG